MLKGKIRVTCLVTPISKMAGMITYNSKVRPTSKEGSRLMNELSIAHGLLKNLQQESKKHGLSRVSRVHIRIGSLCSIAPEALTFAFEAASEGTVAEGAELNIGVVPARGRCDKCDIDFDVDMDTSVFLCPHCGGNAGELICGRELEIALFRGSS